MPLPCNSKHVSTPPVLAVNANTNDSTNNQNTEGISKRICEPKSRFADDLLKIFKNGGEVKNKIMNVMDKVIETGRFDRAALLEKVSRDDPNLSSYLNAAMAMHELMNSGWLESADKTKDKMTFLMEHLNKNSGMTHSKEKSINPSKSRLREHKIPRDFNAERKDRQRRDPYGLSEKMASKYCNDAPVKSDSFGYGINSNSDLEKSSGKPKIGERSANIYNKLSSGAVGAGGVTKIITSNIEIPNNVKTKVDKNIRLNSKQKFTQNEVGGANEARTVVPTATDSSQSYEKITVKDDGLCQFRAIFAIYYRNAQFASCKAEKIQDLITENDEIIRDAARKALDKAFEIIGVNPETKKRIGKSLHSRLVEYIMVSLKENSAAYSPQFLASNNKEIANAILALSPGDRSVHDFYEDFCDNFSFNVFDGFIKDSWKNVIGSSPAPKSTDKNSRDFLFLHDKNHYNLLVKPGLLDVAGNLNP